MKKRKILASGYSDAGASSQKIALKAFNAVSTTPIEDIDWNNATLRQRGRMLYMSTPVAAAAINIVRTKMIGSGLRLKCAINRHILNISDTEAEKWQKYVEAEFEAYASKAVNCDALAKDNFYSLQSTAVKSWLMSGDVFAALKRVPEERFNPYSLRIQLIEADRVRTPVDEDMLDYGTGIYGFTEGITQNGNRIHDGVEVDKNGKIVAYYVHNDYPNQVIWTEPSAAVRVEARGKLTGLPNILQIMDAERPDQYRGVTYYAPAIESFVQARRFVGSTLVAATIQSMMTGWIQRDENISDMSFLEEDEGNGEEESFESEYEMRPGEVYKLKRGEKIVFGNPNVPGTGIAEFLNEIFTMCGAALEIPKEVLLKQFNASYSASKGALEEMREMIKMRRSWFVADFCKPIYEVWLAEAVAKGRIKAPGFFADPLIHEAWCGSRWDGPAQTLLDPKKEAEANELIVKNRWKTNEQVTREFYGENYTDNLNVLAEEAKLMKKAGLVKEEPEERSEDNADTDGENSEADENSKQQSLRNIH